MTSINVQINKTQVVMPDAPEIVSGGVNNLQLSFTFSSDWANYTTKQAIFYRDRNAPLMPIEITNNLCIVPADVIYDWGYFYFGVIGKVDDIVHTTEIVKVKVEKGAFSVETAPTPTPNIYQQMLQVFNSKVDTSVYNAKIAEIESDIENKVLTYRIVGFDVKLNGENQTFNQIHTQCLIGDKVITLKDGDNDNIIYRLFNVGVDKIIFSAINENVNQTIELIETIADTQSYISICRTEYPLLIGENIDQTYSPTSTNAQSGVAFAEGLKTRVPTVWTKLFDDYTTDTEQDTIIVRDTTRNLSQYTEFIVDIKIPAGGAKGYFKTMIAFANDATTAGVYSNYILQNMISTYSPNIPNTPIDQTNNACWLTTHIIMFNGRSMIYQATNTNNSYGYPLCFNANASTPNSLDLRYAYGFIVRVSGRNFPTGTTFSFYAR